MSTVTLDDYEINKIKTLRESSQSLASRREEVKEILKNNPELTEQFNHAIKKLAEALIKVNKL